jgi:hypothetical protein
MSTLALDVWPGAAADGGLSPVETLKTVGAAMLPVVWLQSA